MANKLTYQTGEPDIFMGGGQKTALHGLRAGGGDDSGGSGGRNPAAFREGGKCRRKCEDFAPRNKTTGVHLAIRIC